MYNPPSVSVFHCLPPFRLNPEPSSSDASGTDRSAAGGGRAAGSGASGSAGSGEAKKIPKWFKMGKYCHVYVRTIGDTVCVYLKVSNFAYKC